MPVIAGLALTRHVARLVPWGTLIVGSAAGVGFSLAVRAFAHPATPQAELVTGVRLAFVPPLVGLGFVLHDRHRQLAGALPVPAWVTSALRVVLALPLVAATCWLQFWLVTKAKLPVPPVATEMAGCGLITLAVAAAVERGRWRDLGGGAAVPAALALIGVLAVLSMLKHSPVRLLPTVFSGMTAAQLREWDRAWLAWAAAGAAAAVAAGFFSRDPWRRIRWR